MCKVPHRFGVSSAARLAFVALAAALMAGCADSSRFVGDPLGNPFRSASSEPGAPYGGRDLPSRDLPSRDLSGRSLPGRDVASRDLPPPPPYRPVRTGAIQSRPLAPPSESDLPPRRMAGYATPAHASPRLASTYVPPRTDRTASIPAPSGHGTWSAEGGMAVIAASGDTAGVLAQRYNVPTEALLHENGLSSPAQIQPGTRLVIPVYNANGGGRVAAVAEPPSRRPRDHSSRARLLARHDQVEPPTHADSRLARREDAQREKLARREEADRMRMARAAPPEPVRPRGREAAMARIERAKAERLAKAEEVQAARKVARMDLASQRAAKKVVPPVEVARAAPPPREQPVRVAKAEEAPRKATIDPTPTASLPPPAVADKVSANGNPEFRWPAHGRIIQGFKSGGNDGINIAVPEGTSVKAAESGVVAYAGSEIKGFGNLVLIRHPNGFVTAYANNGDISVRRGEQVKRGQTIAKSGQSGNVASPQLHFELRKGSTPVDPTRYLAGL